MRMPLEEAFLKRSTELLNSMRGRFKEKRNKKGKLIREGRIVPVELDEMRNWIERQLGGKPDGSGRCYYCQAPIDAMNIGIDHGWPASRGGSLGPSNWYPVATDCGCNATKGKLTAQEYADLRKFLATLPPEAQSDIVTRLKTGAGFIRLRFFGRKNKAKEAVDPNAGQRNLESVTGFDDF